MKINILAIAAHPDDVELSCAGTLIAHKDKGYTTGVIDLTRGEMGTRGTPEQRIETSCSLVQNPVARQAVRALRTSTPCARVPPCHPVDPKRATEVALLQS